MRMENGSGERSCAAVRSSSEVQNVLLRFASVHPTELCKEAKVELCRATRDLRSCGRYVEHVLNLCGHACLCVECSKVYDVCPVCRTRIPKNTIVSQLRLYDECVKVGLVSKERDNQFQEDEGRFSTDDVKRLYSFFDIAVEHNLVSLICHYITDVCMDESAVSSDPVMAILLDEIVVTEWCRRTFRSTLADLCQIYKLEVKEMLKVRQSLMKPTLLLSGVANALEVLELSFHGIQSPELEDMHCLSENVLRAKQHLDVMHWCLKHRFLEHMPSRYPTMLSWQSVVNERKSAAVERSWPELLTSLVEETMQPGSTLFIEDALLNLGIEQVYTNTSGELDAASLQKDNSLTSPFRSRVRRIAGTYPFENLHEAVDVLFLWGSSDLAVAKQATLLYYLFDRHWVIPDGEWRKVVDDYATTFGIGRHAVVESFVFYLLDDHTDAALKEACRLLPEIIGTEMHLKIAQVLLERQMPDAALMVLRCSGHDGLNSYSLDNGTNSVPLREAVTAVRVKIECGLLTQAFLHQRAYCSRLKEEQQQLQHKRIIESGYGCWKEQMEILVTELCLLCVRRNLVDRMIELPWNIDEEKCLHKCLLNNAYQDMASTSGSLLVVYYLQRYRYVEAYQVNLNLTKFYDNILSKISDQELVLKIKSVNEWRTGLVEKCIDLLPEVQRQQLKSGSAAGVSFPDKDFSSKAETFGTFQPMSKHPPISPSPISFILPMDVSSPEKPTILSTDAGSPETNTVTPLDSLRYQGSPPLGGQSFPSVRTSFFSCMGSPAGGKSSEPRTVHNLDQGLSDRKTRAVNGIVGGYDLSHAVTPLRETQRGSLRFNFSSSEGPSSCPTGKFRQAVKQNGNGRLNSQSLLWNVARGGENCNEDMETELQEEEDWMSMPSEQLLNKDKGHTPGSLVSGRRLFSREPYFPDRDEDGTTLLSTDRGIRWRSDETSEDDEPGPAKNRIGPPSIMPARARRGRRHFRGTAI